MTPYEYGVWLELGYRSRPREFITTFQSIGKYEEAIAKFVMDDETYKYRFRIYIPNIDRHWPSIRRASYTKAVSCKLRRRVREPEWLVDTKTDYVVRHCLSVSQLPSDQHYKYESFSKAKQFFLGFLKSSITSINRVRAMESFWNYYAPK